MLYAVVSYYQYSSTAAGQNKAYEKWSKASSIIIAPLIELIIIAYKNIY